jgi:nitroreductase
MEIMQAIHTRQSCRNYTDELVSTTALADILDAAKAAPVGMGAYADLLITVIQNKELLREINDNAAKVMGRPNPLYGTPTLILISSKPQDGNLSAIPYANAACIAENMMLAATATGYSSVYLWGAVAAMNEAPEIVAQLHLPDQFIPVSSIAVGKAAETQAPKDRSASQLQIAYIK